MPAPNSKFVELPTELVVVAGSTKDDVTPVAHPSTIEKLQEMLVSGSSDPLVERQHSFLFLVDDAGLVDLSADVGSVTEAGALVRVFEGSTRSRVFVYAHADDDCSRVIEMREGVVR